MAQTILGAVGGPLVIEDKKHIGTSLVGGSKDPIKNYIGTSRTCCKKAGGVIKVKYLSMNHTNRHISSSIIKA